MANKIIGYARISTKSQVDNTSIENQEQIISSKYPGAEIRHEQFSGKTLDRPVFQDLIKDLNCGDTLVVTKLDRFARNTIDGLQVVQDLLDRGVSIHILNMGYIDNTPQGKMMLTMFMAFAEFERSQIVERMQSAREFKRKTDPTYKEGRPRKINDNKINTVVDMRNQGKTYDDIASILGLGRNTIARMVKMAKADGLLD